MILFCLLKPEEKNKENWKNISRKVAKPTKDFYTDLVTEKSEILQLCDGTPGVALLGRKGISKSKRHNLVLHLVQKMATLGREVSK